MKWICPACKEINEDETLKCCCGYECASEGEMETLVKCDLKIEKEQIKSIKPKTLYLCSFLLGLILVFLFPITVLPYLELSQLFGRNLATIFYVPLFFVIIRTLYMEGKRSLGKYESKRMVSKTFSVLHTSVFFFGIYGSIWCRQHHISRGGHMVWGIIPSEILLDKIWAAGLVSATVAAIWSKKAYAPVFLTLTTWIIIFRFYFRSAGGIFPFPL